MKKLYQQKKWSGNGNGVEVDPNRLNGMDIDDNIIQFEDNNEIKGIFGENCSLKINSHNRANELKNISYNIDK